MESLHNHIHRGDGTADTSTCHENLGAAFCFKTPSPDPRSGPIALLSQSPDSCTAILHTSLTDQKKNKKNWPIGNLNTEIHPFVRRLKTGGIKKKKIKAGKVRCSQRGVLCGSDGCFVVGSLHRFKRRNREKKRQKKREGQCFLYIVFEKMNHRS